MESLDRKDGDLAPKLWTGLIPTRGAADSPGMRNQLRRWLNLANGRSFAMGQAVAVQTDHTSGKLPQLAKRVKHAAQARRLLAIAAVLDGASREEAATVGGYQGPQFATALATISPQF
jgi:hypothetical protein